MTVAAMHRNTIARNSGPPAIPWDSSAVACDRGYGCGDDSARGNPRNEEAVPDREVRTLRREEYADRANDENEQGRRSLARASPARSTSSSLTPAASRTKQKPDEQNRELVLELPKIAVDAGSEVADDHARNRDGENPAVRHEFVAPLIEKQHVGEREYVLVTLGHDVSNAKQAGERKSRSHTRDRPKTEARGENHWRGPRSNRFPGAPPPSINAARIAPIGSIRTPSASSSVAIRGRNRNMRTKGPITVGPVTTTIAPKTKDLIQGQSRHQRAASAPPASVISAPQVTRRRIAGLFAPQPRYFEVEAALEQNDRDREVDDGDQTQTERVRIDPGQPVGAEGGAGQ